MKKYRIFNADGEKIKDVDRQTMQHMLDYGQIKRMPATRDYQLVTNSVLKRGRTNISDGSKASQACGLSQVMTWRKGISYKFKQIDVREIIFFNGASWLPFTEALENAWCIVGTPQRAKTVIPNGP
jgi:hypothetical protein